MKLPFRLYTKLVLFFRLSEAIRQLISFYFLVNIILIYQYQYILHRKVQFGIIFPACRNLIEWIVFYMGKSRYKLS